MKTVWRKRWLNMMTEKEWSGRGKWSMLEDEEVQKLTILDVQVTVFTSYLQGISLTPDNRQFINMELETFFQERPALKRKKQ